MEDFLSLLGALLLLVVLIILAPWLSFWLAYFGGWLAKITIGAKLCAALNILFNTSYFTPAMLPMMSGALGWIGGFFKATTTATNLKSKKDKER